MCVGGGGAHGVEAAAPPPPRPVGGACGGVGRGGVRGGRAAAHCRRVVAAARQRRRRSCRPAPEPAVLVEQARRALPCPPPSVQLVGGRRPSLSPAPSTPAAGAPLPRGRLRTLTPPRSGRQRRWRWRRSCRGSRTRRWTSWSSPAPSRMPYRGPASVPAPFRGSLPCRSPTLASPSCSPSSAGSPPRALRRSGGTGEDEIFVDQEDDPDIRDDHELGQNEVTAIKDKDVYKKKLERRASQYKIKLLNPCRKGKKLLVLDIDYTLFDHRSAAENPEELMRPYLHQFLSAAYSEYDIMIWSATG